MKSFVTRPAFRVLVGVAAAAGTVSLIAASPGSVAQASAHQQITGSGSSWAANAVNQWVSDVYKSGLQVVFTSDGSAIGRRDFADQTSLFAVSDIGYQGIDPESGASDTPCQDPSNKSSCIDYAYVPIVAGGTSFPYQIRVGGKLVTNLRLSGETLTKIFTDKITNWDDPEITHDNNGHKLPNLPIIPVVHSEGSGSSAQFTRYMATEYPSLWKPFNNGKDVEAEYFPAGQGQVAQNGSDGVINYLTSAAANGSIGYDEYSYALGKNYPVVQVENKAGYFTSPTQYNVAVALTKAQINYNKSSPDYLLQNLNHVYTNPDKRTYPLSSYSYGIIPIGPNSNDHLLNTSARQTLADFLYYSICQGQGEIGPIGYSALPINLVEASFQQVGKLHAADKGVNLNRENVTTCHNPTFIAGHPKENHLAQIAPEPLACQEVGHGPCGVAPAYNGGGGGGNGGGGGGNGGGGGANGGGGGGNGGGGGGNGGGGGGNGGGGGGNGGGGGGNGGGGGGNTVPGGGGGGTSPTLTATNVVGTPVDEAAASNGGIGGILAGLAVLELLVIIALPAFLISRFNRSKQAP
jgi:phosphate transport system substrate-binding protein